MYELLANKSPFGSSISYFKILNRIIEKKYRPIIPSSVPDSIKQLLSSCWSNNPKKRPSFDTIVDPIKNESLLITDEIDKDEFLTYVEYIDYCELYNKSLDFDEYISLINGEKCSTILNLQV